jgi:hypothetical protein
MGLAHSNPANFLDGMSSPKFAEEMCPAIKKHQGCSEKNIETLSIFCF